MEGIKGAISMVEKKWKSSWTMQNLASSDRLSANILLGLKLFLSLKTSLKTHVWVYDLKTLWVFFFFLVFFILVNVRKRKKPSGCGHVCQPSARSKVLQLTYKPQRDGFSNGNTDSLLTWATLAGAVIINDTERDMIQAHKVINGKSKIKYRRSIPQRAWLNGANL